MVTERISCAACLLAAAALALPLSACSTRTIDTQIIDRGGIQVFLRHHREQGEDVERGFAHPAHISPRRLARILSSLAVEESGREGFLRKKVTRRRPVFDQDLVEPIAGALSDAFGQASSKHEIAVLALQTQRRYVVFERSFVTSFVALIKGDALYLDLSRVRWEIPKDREDRRPPMPERGERVMSFRALPGPGVTQAGPQLLAIRWRDPAFAEDEAERPKAAGESPEPAAISEKPSPDVAPPSTADLPPGLSSATLHELADLERAREQGEIDEGDYQREREELLRRAAEQTESPR